MWFQLFTDPILRGPTIATMLMCMTQAVVGVFLFISKKSLIGEVASHATYPGVASALVVLSVCGLQVCVPFIFLGGMTSALLGVLFIEFLENRGVKKDSALCAVLALFFGLGTLVVSYLQQTNALVFHHITVYLYGQAATMLDEHIYFYGALSLGVLSIITLFYRKLKILFFDPLFAITSGIHIRREKILFFMIFSLTIVCGLRCVGIILISGMLILPPLAARFFTHRLPSLLCISGFIGLISGYLGNFFSLYFHEVFHKIYPTAKVSFPTGPMIILAACFIGLLAFCFSPKQGKILSLFFSWKTRCIFKLETLLLCCDENPLFKPTNLSESMGIYFLQKKGFLKKSQGDVEITDLGKAKALEIKDLYQRWFHQLESKNYRLPFGSKGIKSLLKENL